MKTAEQHTRSHYEIVGYNGSPKYLSQFQNERDNWHYNMTSSLSLTMITTQRCILLILNRKHLKKIIIIGWCLGIAFVIIYMYELPGVNKTSQVETLDNLSDAQYHLWMEIMSLRMERRKKKLQEQCELFKLNIKGNDSLHRPNEWEFLINRPFRLVWCNVFKAASTSWMYNFNILAGYTKEFLQYTKKVPLQLAREKYPRPSLKSLEAALNDSTSFLIVRHPFERLLSGYRDKIENALPNTYHYKLGNRIVMKYREKEKMAEKSFFEFLKKSQSRPTFFEFVEFVISLHQSGAPLDMHWTPITTFCTPCQVRFDIIMKFETLNDDQNYLIHKKNLKKLIKPQWKNPTKGKRSIISLLEKYYSQLNVFQIHQLYNIYKYDFYLFDYKINDYLRYITSNKKITNELKIFLETDKDFVEAMHLH